MKRRKDQFFGLHFDRHAVKENTGIGEGYSGETIERICKEIKPDFIQTDAKGYAGLSCYPTKVGNPAPNIKEDILKIWREVTLKYDIPLYAHFCGVVDKECGKLHPEWSALDLLKPGESFFENGVMSVFGPYVDKLMIPQLLELANEYNLNGVWVDAENYATAVDVSDWAVRAYENEYGKKAPENAESKNFREYLSFLRAGFKKYVEKYVSAVKKVYPEFEICSNMTMGSCTPDNEEYPIDFVSVDYCSVNAIESVRYEARLMQHRGKPWDCMAWDYRSSMGQTNHYSDLKPAIQLCQEAAAVISLGGAFQIYHHMGFYKPVVFEEAFIKTGKEVAEFCRARQEFCFNAEAVPDVGIVFSSKNYYDTKDTPFGRPGYEYEPSVTGVMNIFLNNSHSVDFILSHQSEKFSQYPVLVLANMKVIEPELKIALIQYVENGGKLILAGPDTLRLFENELSVSVGSNGEKGANFNLCVKHDGGVTDIRSSYVYVKPIKAEVKAYAVNGEYLPEPENIPVVFAENFGKGRLVGIAFDIGTDYYLNRNATLRNFIESIIGYDNPRVVVNGSKYVDVVLTEKSGIRMLNLVNTCGEHADLRVGSFDEIPALYDLEVRFACPYKPSRLIMEPDGKELEFVYKDGMIDCKVDCLRIHAILSARK